MLIDYGGNEMVKKLREGKRIIGTMIRMIRNPAIAQIAKGAGLDFIMVDMEHGSYSIETFSNIAKVARSIGLGIFVRVPELAKGYVSRVLDAGADGVMVPMVSTKEDAEALANWAKYSPLGKRGLGSSGGHTSFAGMNDTAKNFMQKQNELTLSIAQIETKDAIKNIEKIASINGIDVLLIGPNDLSISLGVPGETMSKPVSDAIEKVAEACKKYNKVFAMHSGSNLLDKWVPKGMRMIMNSLDVNVLQLGFKDIAEKYKS